MQVDGVLKGLIALDKGRVNDGLGQYVTAFRKLRSDASRDYPAASRGRAPYKPLLLLSVIDQTPSVRFLPESLPPRRAAR